VIRADGGVLFLLLVLVCPAIGGKRLIRKAGEIPPIFAQRLLPRGTVLASPIQEIALGRSSRALVLLFGETPENYDEGWVLTPIPGTRGQYHKYLLPPTDEINLPTVAAPSFRVKAVFSALLRRGAAPSLLILYAVRGFGAVKDDRTRSYEQEYVTEACRWTGQGFAFDPLGDRLAGLSTEKAIRRRLQGLK